MPGNEGSNDPSEDVAAGLIRTLFENLRKASEAWESMSMVLGFDSEGVKSVHGFVYDAHAALSKALTC